METFIFMTIREIIKYNFLNEERDICSFLYFTVVVGEDEGEHIPHIHLISNKLIGNGIVGYKMTAVRLDSPYYFLHGKYKYRFNSKELREFIKFLNNKPAGKIIFSLNGKEPKNNLENFINTWNKVNNDNLENNVNPLVYKNMLESKR